MSSTNARNIVELRQLLAEKFPGVRHTAERPESIAPRCATGVPPIDFLLQGGLPKGAITEITSPGISSGAGLLLGSLLEQARLRGEWMALVDAGDSFDPAGLKPAALSKLLWVRCDNVRDAIKATDMLLHDGTIPVVTLDLLFSQPGQLRKIPSSTWFRLQRILGNNSTALVVLASEHMIGNAAARLELQRRFNFDSLDQPRDNLTAQVIARIPEIAGRRIVKIA